MKKKEKYTIPIVRFIGFVKKECKDKLYYSDEDGCINMMQVENTQIEFHDDISIEHALSRIAVEQFDSLSIQYDKKKK